jgi:cytochrome c556
LAALLVTAASGAPLVLYPEMKAVVAPQAQILWDVGNRGMDDDGNPDGSRLTAADWEALGKAAEAMRASSERMAAASAITVVAPGAKIQDEGTPGAATPQQIEAWIAADPKAFASHARDLAAVAAEFAQAATARDAVKLASASGRLDEVCEACHMQFWYPAAAAP